MSKIPSTFESFIVSNLGRVLDKETKDTLGDRSKYIGASDIGGCPYKVVKDKQNPPKHSIKQQIIFQRGHIAENLVKKMLDGLHVEDQFEVLGEFEQFELKAHLDFLIQSKAKNVIVEAKTVSAPIEEPYESWVLQVTYQMGLLMQENLQTNVEAYVLALDLNTGWLKTFKIEFDDALFELCLSKASHIIDALRGHCEPKAIIQNYCSSCHLKMQCPKQGLHAQDLPEDIKQDLEFIKRAKEIAKESKQREKRVKEYLVNMGIEIAKDEEHEVVVSVKEVAMTRFDAKRFQIENPDMSKEYVNNTSYFKLNVI